MNEKDSIRLAMKKRGLTQAELAKLAGYKSQSNINGLLNRNKKGIRMDVLVPLLSAMNYRIEIINNEDNTDHWTIDGKQFDPDCWQKVPDGYKCPICDAVSTTPTKFCPNCGHKFKNINNTDA